MAFHTTIRSRSAIAVGVFFSGVTAYVLLEDVFRHGAPLTTKHVMTLAVLGGTVYFGHSLWRELRAWRLGTAFGCAALFLAGTTTCVVMSAGRNAEVVSNKVLAANSVNTARASAQKDRDEARIRYQAALKAEEDECSSGSGGKCQSKRITRMVRREEYDATEAKLRQEQPEQIANSDIRAAAELVARLPYVTASVGAVEALLQLAFPFLQSLFCEIGAIVGFAIGLGHKARDEALPGAKPEAKPTVPSVQFNKTERNQACSIAKTMARIDLIGYVESHGSIPNQDFLVERWRRSKGTVSYWLADWEREGLIRRHRDGKFKVTKITRALN